MSAAPPPPPYSAHPAPPPVAQQSRRELRDQRRSARAALRQQKAIRQVQQRLQQRRSVVGPVLLTAFGATLLALQAGYLQLSAVLLWLGRWWPLILLLGGVLLLLEGVVDSRLTRTSGAGTAPRRRLGPGTILLVVLVAALGLSGRTLEQLSGWAQHSGNANLLGSFGLDRFFAQHLQDHAVLTAPMANGALLTVRSYAGTVNVTGDSQDGQVHVVADQELTAWDSQQLREHQGQGRPVLQPDGTGLLLTAAGQGLDHTNLTIQLPHQAGLKVLNGQGNLVVNEVHGSVAVTGHQGNVQLSALTGPVAITSQDEDASITAHSLSGDIALTGRAGDLDFSDVTGSLRLEGDFFGNTHLERIHAPIHFKSSFTDLSFGGLSGQLQIEGRSELTANGVQGPVTVTTTDRTLTLTDVSGPVVISDRNGPVHLSLTLPLNPVSVSTTDADLELRLPDAGFRLDAQTTNGAIDTYSRLPSETRGEATVVKGQVGTGGPSVKLLTTQGHIAVLRQKAGDGSSSDNDDEAADHDN